MSENSTDEKTIRQHVFELRRFIKRQRARLSASKRRCQVEVHLDIETFELLVATADAAVSALERKHGGDGR